MRTMVVVILAVVLLSPKVRVQAGIPLGACCVGGECQESDSITCTIGYHGDDTPCLSSPCAAQGACWDQSGCCVVTEESACTTAGRDYKGNDTQCPLPDGQCVPTLSDWNVVVLGLLTLTAGTILLQRRRSAVCG